jgi:hypothetical protein
VKTAFVVPALLVVSLVASIGAVDRVSTQTQPPGPLEGDWIAVEEKEAPFGEAFGRIERLRITRSNFDLDSKRIKGMFFLSEPPHRLDLRGERLRAAIYRWDHETLTVCWGAERPTEFSAPSGSGRLLVVFKRAKRGGNR